MINVDFGDATEATVWLVRSENQVQVIVSQPSREDRP